MQRFSTLGSPLVTCCLDARALILVAAVGSCELQEHYTILVHGGTVTRSEDVTDAQMALIRTVVTEARESLASGGTALDVVTNAIVQLEDSGLLDAGKGSYRNTAGFVETDASLMEGHTGRSGAVAGMQRLKNPILGARLVMEKTRHVFFVGLAGEETLVGLGAETVADPATYFVPYREMRSTTPGPGTVGAVALDRCGHLAAGTSTGGTAGKLPGRVGDSPIIGASTFANDRCALSATGVGEYFIRRSVTRDIAMRAEYQGRSLQAAADYVIHELIGAMDKVPGAIIAIDREGEVILSAANVLGERYGYASAFSDPIVGVEMP
jgi:isoaspartyl peptidase/L-asparaginase-like protein (Ntn-hydrolase superfamily)